VCCSVSKLDQRCLDCFLCLGVPISCYNISHRSSASNIPIPAHHHIHIKAHARAHVHAHTRTRAHANTQSVRTYTYTHTYTAHIHTRTHIYTRTHAEWSMRAHTHHLHHGRCAIGAQFMIVHFVFDLVAHVGMSANIESQMTDGALCRFGRRVGGVIRDKSLKVYAAVVTHIQNTSSQCTACTARASFQFRQSYKGINTSLPFDRPLPRTHNLTTQEVTNLASFLEGALARLDSDSRCKSTCSHASGASRLPSSSNPENVTGPKKDSCRVLSTRQPRQHIPSELKSAATRPT